jgi:uncharacterized membrane protein
MMIDDAVVIAMEVATIVLLISIYILFMNMVTVTRAKMYRGTKISQ